MSATLSPSVANKRYAPDCETEETLPKRQRLGGAPGEASADGHDDDAKVQRGYHPEHPARVYADGVFDMFHYGHARALEQAKKVVPYAILIVGVTSDDDTHRIKGRTVMDERERAECVRHCKWVDEVIERCPWVITQEFMDDHRIDFVAHDAEPYVDNSGNSDDSADVYAFVKKLGKFKATKRTSGVSTSGLLTRILRDYETYVLRNLDRGVSRHTLNVSFIKEKQIKLGSTMATWKDNMERWSRDFISLFGEDGAVGKYFLS